MLRYGATCGQSYAAHGREGAAQLLRTHGSIPALLEPDEAAGFTDAFGPAGAEAGALLRALLAPTPGARPAHALEISRMLERIHARMMPAPVARAA